MAGCVYDRYNHLVNLGTECYTTMGVKLAILSLMGDLNVNLELETHQETSTSFKAHLMTPTFKYLRKQLQGKISLPFDFLT